MVYPTRHELPGAQSHTAFALNKWGKIKIKNTNEKRPINNRFKGELIKIAYHIEHINSKKLYKRQGVFRASNY